MMSISLTLPNSVTQAAEKNLMTTDNLAIIWAPSLLGDNDIVDAGMRHFHCLTGITLTCERIAFGNCGDDAAEQSSDLRR